MLKIKAFVLIIFVIVGLVSASEPTSNFTALASSDTPGFSAVDGSYKAKIVDPKKLPKVKTYSEFEDIPTKELRANKNKVYQLGKNHYLIHKSQLGYPQTSKNDDLWFEVLFTNPTAFYGKPIADTVLYAQSGGSVSFSKSLELGVSSARYSSFQRSAGAVGASTSGAFTFGPSVSVSASASCKIPAGKTGGLYLFERSEQFNGQIREWSWKSTRFSGSKYLAGDWEQKQEAIRAFKHPVFVCSLDPVYIESLKEKTYESQPLADFSDFVPH